MVFLLLRDLDSDQDTRLFTPPSSGGARRAMFYFTPPDLFPAKAAGLGLEPRYPPPEGGVLPLDDPAALARNFFQALPPFQLFILISSFLASVKLLKYRVYINSHGLPLKVEDTSPLLCLSNLLIGRSSVIPI